MQHNNLSDEIALHAHPSLCGATRMAVPLFSRESVGTRTGTIGTMDDTRQKNRNAQQSPNQSRRARGAPRPPETTRDVGCVWLVCLSLVDDATTRRSRPTRPATSLCDHNARPLALYLPAAL